MATSGTGDLNSPADTPNGDDRRGKEWVKHPLFVGIASAIASIVFATGLNSLLASHGFGPYASYVRKPPVRIDVAASALGASTASSEYVCLVNKSDGPVDLTRWVLRDAKRIANTLPNFILQAHAGVRVHPGGNGAKNTKQDIYGTYHQPVWNNETDMIVLLDVDGNVVDQTFYSSTSETVTRCGD